MDYFAAMEPALRTFWYIAIPTSLIFIIQSVMTFIGVDSSDGIEADFDSNLEGAQAPFQLFSLRNLINFLLGFSWAGISFFHSIASLPLLLLAAALTGTAFVLLFFVIIKQLQKLAEDNSFHINQTLNKTAEVYLPIPAHKSGIGKVLVSVKGSIRELSAITEGERLIQGLPVRIIKIQSDNLLVVESI